MVKKMEDMIRMLAGAPVDQRRAMMKSRLEMLAAMPKEQRLNGMAEMITAVSRLPEEKRKIMISDRNRIVAEFSPETRDTIMESRVALAMKLPKEVNELDMMTIMQTLPDLPENLKMVFVGSMKRHMEAAGMPMPQMPGMAMPGQGAIKAAAAAAPSGPADMLKAQEDMMRQLATAPEEMRRSALKGRFDEILAGSDDQLRDSLKVMMQALSKLSDGQRRTLIGTRSYVIGSRSDDQIKRILTARAMAMKGLENLDKEDRMVMMEEMPWVPEGPRMRLSNVMMSFMKSMGMPPPPMPSTPMHHGKPMQKTGFFSKSWKCETCGRGFPAT